MISFFLKSGISMVLLFGLYWLLLRKEKLFIFTRFYLIFSIIFSLVVPLVSIPVHLRIVNANEPVAGEAVNTYELPGINQTAVAFPSVKEEEISGISLINTPPVNQPGPSHPFKWQGLLPYVYIAGLFLMIVRFFKNILLISRNLKNAEIINRKWYKIALLDIPVNPFSFIGTIYLFRLDYEKDLVSPNVIRHETEHIRQLHSFDVIFFEILHALFWFNPVLILYKKAVKVNHEYLADNAVVSDSTDVVTYSNELVNFIFRSGNVSFTSGFSPSIIRRRLLMINKPDTGRYYKTARAVITAFGFCLLGITTMIKPVLAQKKAGLTQPVNTDIVIDELNFRGPDFNPLKSIVILNGKRLEMDDTLEFDPKLVKNISVLKGRDAKRKFGRIAKSGVLEITTYDAGKNSIPDSLYFKSMYTVNDKVPYGKVSIPYSNLFSSSIWNYPIFPNQDLRKRWRTICFVTRDYYQIRGQVVDNSGIPLSGAMLTVEGHPEKIETGSDGRFIMKDVNPGSIAHVTADGYQQLNFMVRGVVFTLDLLLTLDKDDEMKNSIAANYFINDFSGTWKYNKELSRTSLPYASLDLNIIQFDSDSIKIDQRIIYDFSNYSNYTDVENVRERMQTDSFILNTVKTRVDLNGTKTERSCTIDPDGQSFAVSYRTSSSIRATNGYKKVEKYSLDNTGSQLTIATYTYIDDSEAGLEGEVLVFDRN